VLVKACPDEALAVERAPRRQVNQQSDRSGTAVDESPTVDRVAMVVSGMSVIGQARNALAAAGWSATITANRITVDDQVLAHFVPGRVGSVGRNHAHWAIYSAAGADAIRFVRADWHEGDSQSSCHGADACIRRVSD